MVAVTEVFREVLDGKRTAADGRLRFEAPADFAHFPNGFFYERDGAAQWSWS